MTRLIDADALNLDYEVDMADDWKTAHEIANIVKYAPTIDAEPVCHGKWTVTPIYIKCSECGESFMLIPQNYCPNCGARMDKE